MLRLFVHIKNLRLMVREVTTKDPFIHPIKWDDVEFIYQKSADYMVLWTSFLPDLPPDYAEALIRLQCDRYPLSRRYQELKQICPEIVFSQDSDEWIFFGGSFNPWHDGHQAAINLLPEDKVCFILPDNNPHKELKDYDLVVKILELSSRIRLKKNQFLLPNFLIEKTQNPTVNWIERLKKDYPNKKLSLLLGFDSFNALPTWTRYKDLLKNLESLYVISRLETDQMRINALNKISGPDVIFLGRHEFENASSTKIRGK